MHVRERDDGIPRGVWIAWLVANVVGALLVALPDTDARLFSFSRTHGPSVVDAIGSVVLLAGWVILDTAVVRRWHRVLALSRATRLLLVGAIVVGVAVLVPTIAFDLGAWWVVGVLLLAGAQVAAAIAVGRSGGR